jgi:uncharacterized SAM-binding protein YcdF (DUF218 family)
MYFIISKVLLFLIFPINWIIVLLLIAIFTKRRKLKKWTTITGIILLIIFSNTWLCNWFAHTWEVKRVTLPDSARYSSAIILGGFVSQINEKEGYFNHSSDRFIEGVRLYTTGKVSHLLISGGNGALNPDGFSEGKWVREQLRQLKFADSSILIEGKSRNTLENAKYSAALLKQSGLKPPYLLVTSGFHMRRALRIFRNNGVDVLPYPCDFISSDVGRPTFVDLIPNFEALTWWNTTIKEEWGYVINYFMKTND